MTQYSNHFDLNNIQNVTRPDQPIGWIFSHVKVNFVFKQYLYQLGDFKVHSVEVSPSSNVANSVGDSDDVVPYPEKLTRADYAYRGDEEQKEKKETKFLSLTEKAQSILS